MDYGPPAPLSMGLSRQEYCSGLPFPPPGDLPNPGIEPTSSVFPALQADSLLLSLWETWGHKEMIALVAVIVPTSALELCHINTQSTTVRMFLLTIQDSFLL